jgi:hypothetical protein
MKLSVPTQKNSVALTNFWFSLQHCFFIPVPMAKKLARRSDFFQVFFKSIGNMRFADSVKDSTPYLELVCETESEQEVAMPFLFAAATDQSFELNHENLLVASHLANRWGLLNFLQQQMQQQFSNNHPVWGELNRWAASCPSQAELINLAFFENVFWSMHSNIKIHQRVELALQNGYLSALEKIEYKWDCRHLDLAVSYGHLPIVKFLFETKRVRSDVSMLAAATHGRLTIMQYLHAKGVAINAWTLAAAKRSSDQAVVDWVSSLVSTQ